MTTSRREFLAGAAAAGALTAGAAAAAPASVTPEQFGATGDGRTNDTDAFAAMSAFVTRSGGGAVSLRPVTYIVGRQGAAGGETDPRRRFGFPPATIMHFAGCAAPLAIRGNGARLRCAGGLRFGTFDPATAARTDNDERFRDRKQLATPYLAMINVVNCSGLVEISDIELDGNLSELVIGGKWSKGGWQIAANGITLADNTGTERLSNINSHHHPLDGLYIKGPSDRASASVISEVTCSHNARQGCTISGGRNYAFDRCRFLHTGWGGLRSAPSSGVDIEPHVGRTARNLSFSTCEFSDNAGAGVVADSGDSEGVRFEYCRFIGTTSWSAWPNKPAMRFSNCLFVGALAHARGDPDSNRAVQFHDCEFRDDPALSPNGKVFGGRSPTQRIAVLRNNPNVLFNRCRFALTHELILPMSTSAVRYSDCTMSQRSPTISRPNGTYSGTSRLSGAIDLRRSVILGDVVLNGRTLPK